MNFERSSGVLMHVTSLPGKYGIGEIGPQAHRFVEWLAESSQKWWQVLPLGPTGYGDSPYQSFSTFAGNPLVISFDLLKCDGLLEEDWLVDFPLFEDGNIDYGSVIYARNLILEKVTENFPEKAAAEIKADFLSFCERESEWLNDYAVYMALKDFHNGKPWYEWPADLRCRGVVAIAKVMPEISDRVNHYKILQFLFDKQWNLLRQICAGKGIKILGDIPIFVASDSADVWANSDLFLLDGELNPKFVAGVPPDYFSETGQLWGNPLYDWDKHKKTGYAWWVSRIKKMLSRYDAIRIDHFRGFEKFWQIPAGDDSAVNGEWVEGPGSDLFEALEKELGKGLPLIAENLGVITDEVEELRNSFAMPGMIVLQFRFGEDDLHNYNYRPEGTEENNVIYTGTHDNDTTFGWLQNPTGNIEKVEENILMRETVLNYLESDRSDPVGDLIHLAMSSPAVLCVTPMQDLIRFDGQARMNKPGVSTGNWQWRCTFDHFNSGTSEWLARTTRMYNR